MSPPRSAVLEPLFVQPVAATSAAINPRAIKVRLIFTSLKRKVLMKLRNGRLKQSESAMKKIRPRQAILLRPPRPLERESVSFSFIEREPLAVAHVLLTMFSIIAATGAQKQIDAAFFLKSNDAHYTYLKPRVESILP